MRTVHIGILSQNRDETANAAAKVILLVEGEARIAPVEGQTSALQRAAAEKQITVEMRADGCIPKTIVRNPVSNGIKFTPEGGTGWD